MKVGKERKKIKAPKRIVRKAEPIRLPQEEPWRIGYVPGVTMPAPKIDITGV